MRKSLDAVVVGSGPNGLTAAVVLARAKRSVLVLEGNESIGGGTRSAELTLPGFLHDVCSAVHPLAIGSPCLHRLPLAQHGLIWVHPETPLAHPFDDGSAVLLERSVTATASGVGCDAAAYFRLVRPLARDWTRLAEDVLGPLRFPRHPLLLSRFGVHAIRSARRLAESVFRGVRARALFAGLAAHAMLPLEDPATAAFGLILAAAGHAVGWPMPRGGAQQIANALAACLRSAAGQIVTGRHVHDLAELPVCGSVLLDVTPRQLLRLAGDRLPESYRRRLSRYRYGMGAFKVDWALSAPIPWRASLCARAGTVHLGGTLEEIAAAERAAANGEHPDRPFVLVAQPSLFDATRAPGGQHTVWAYCHVPNGSRVDMTARIERQIERFAPGFSARILARHATSPAGLEASNPNYVGGDINGGAQDVWQLFTRPVLRRVPYSTPIPGLYLCSSSTPPGGGVHGMCGYFAARAALKYLSARTSSR